MLSEPEHSTFHVDSHEHCCLLYNEQVIWIDNIPDEPSVSVPNLIEQFDSDSKTSDYQHKDIVSGGGDIYCINQFSRNSISLHHFYLT